MLITSVLTATLETALNQLLYRERSLKAARQRLHGKTLQIELAEMDTPLVFVFSERRLDVVSHWDNADCRLKTRLAVLVKLRDRQHLSSLMRDGDLIVEGDIQVAQQLIALLDLAEIDPAEWLAPYLGDVVAQGISQTAQKTLGAAKRVLCGQRQALSETLTEEWRLAPGKLENAWLQDEIAALESSIDNLNERLMKLETPR